MECCASSSLFGGRVEVLSVDLDEEDDRKDEEAIGIQQTRTRDREARCPGSPLEHFVDSDYVNDAFRLRKSLSNAA